MKKVFVFVSTTFIISISPFILKGQTQIIEAFPPNKIELKAGPEVISNMWGPCDCKISSKYTILYKDSYYKTIDKIIDNRFPNEPFQILINGQIVNPSVGQVSETGKYFLFSKDNSLYLFDLEKRTPYLIENNSNYRAFFINKDQNLILIFGYGYNRDYQGYNSTSYIINLSALEKSTIENLYYKRSINLEYYLISANKNVNDIYIRTPGYTYSFINAKNKINKPLWGFSDDFKFGFYENELYDLKQMKLVYQFNKFYKITSIANGIIITDYQNQQTHHYNLDRILVYGKYLNEINRDFTTISQKDEFETATEAEARITTAKETILRKYENLFAEEKKVLVKKIIDSYKQVTFSIDSIGAYVAEKQAFPITVNGTKADIIVPREEAKEFKINFKDAKCTGIEQLDEAGTTVQTFNIKISNPITGSVYPFGNQIQPLYINETTIETAESGVPVLELQARFVEPSNNQILDGNETAYVEVDISNKGTGTARDLRFNLDIPKVAGLSGETAQSMTGLTAGQTKTVKFKINSTRSLITSDNLEFKLSATEWKGFNPVPIVLKIQSQSFKEPKLQFIDVGVSEITGNNNNIIENNEIIEATALIQNKGQGIAKNVRVAFQIDDKNIISMTPDAMYQSIDSLNPGEDKAVKVRFSVNNQYQGTDALPISIKLSELWNEYGSQNNLGLELKKTNFTAKNIKIEGEYSKDVRINDVSLTSDIDKNIPELSCEPDTSIKKYALIIGNENYSKYQTGLNTESNVDFAINDANTFTKYLEKTLCLPKEHIITVVDANSSTMKREIQKLVRLIQYSEGKAEVIFYYAGHGFPDEQTKESYLVPVDVNASSLTDGISLSKLYNDLTQHPSQKVTVFLDACFTGGGRNAGLLAARGIKIKPKTETVKGNLVVFSASSGDQSSLPNKEKQHGMFSYFLMKKIQESKGEVNYEELANYIRKEVQLNSVLLNGKDQNPDVLISPELIPNWTKLKLK
jgi:hypothetical protein